MGLNEGQKEGNTNRFTWNNQRLSEQPGAATCTPEGHSLELGGELGDEKGGKVWEKSGIASLGMRYSSSAPLGRAVCPRNIPWAAQVWELQGGWDGERGWRWECAGQPGRVLPQHLLISALFSCFPSSRRNSGNCDGSRNSSLR